MAKQSRRISREQEVAILLSLKKQGLLRQRRGEYKGNITGIGRRGGAYTQRQLQKDIDLGKKTVKQIGVTAAMALLGYGVYKVGGRQIILSIKKGKDFIKRGFKKKPISSVTKKVAKVKKKIVKKKVVKVKKKVAKVKKKIVKNKVAKVKKTKKFISERMLDKVYLKLTREGKSLSRAEVKHLLEIGKLDLI